MNKPTSPEYSRGWLAGYREAAADRYTLDQIEAWLRSLYGDNWKIGTGIGRLHDKDHGLAAHARKEDEG